MKILSIYPYLTISSSALIINGKVVSASTEERFNRHKNSTVFPIKSIEWSLKKNNLVWNDLDLIVVPWNPAKHLNDASSRWIENLRWRGEMPTSIPSHIMTAMNTDSPNNFQISWNKTKIKFLNHHECHAAFSFFQSPFNNADILTIDGRGEDETCGIFKGSGKNIKKLYGIDFPHSLGLLYGAVTEFLGFRANSDEWKVMALSSYSKRPNKFDKIFDKVCFKSKKGFELDLSYFDYYLFDKKKYMFSKKFVDSFGSKRNKDTKLLRSHYEIAGALQRKFSSIVLHLIKLAKKRSKNKNIVLSGGAMMNSVFNGEFDGNKIYKDSHISYAPDDSGVAIGAGLLAYYKFSKKSKRLVKETKSNFFGPEYNEKEIKKTLDNFKIKYERAKNIYLDTARELANGKIIGWFQGKMEFGPRALGNRSILADPRKKNNKDLVNKAVKFRENFRPFAPAVLDEDKNEIFEMPKKREVNFMERVYKIKKSWLKRIPAVVHVDNTGRIQTVNKSINPKFFQLISEFKKMTGVPVILNTSFNLNNEPIVMSPQDAIKSFYTCGLDTLVIGSFIIRKK